MTTETEFGTKPPEETRRRWVAALEQARASLMADCQKHKANARDYYNEAKENSGTARQAWEMMAEGERELAGLLEAAAGSLREMEAHLIYPPEVEPGAPVSRGGLTVGEHVVYMNDSGETWSVELLAFGIGERDGLLMIRHIRSDRSLWVREHEVRGKNESWIRRQTRLRKERQG